MENKSIASLILAIVGVAVIAGAFAMFDGQNINPDGQVASVGNTAAMSLAKDKIRGSKDAPIKLVVYSDLECPACKHFHQQLKAIEDNYVNTGKVALAFRHFPLDSLHKKARQEAVATECANDIGGEEMFWRYLDKIFETTPSNDGLDLALLPKLAADLGIDSIEFETCLNSGKFDSAIQASVDEAQDLKIGGTPYFVVEGPNGQLTEVPGSIPAENLTQLFDSLLKPATETNNNATTTE